MPKVLMKMKVLQEINLKLYTWNGIGFYFPIRTQAQDPRLKSFLRSAE